MPNTKGWKYGIGIGLSILLLFMANLWVGSVRIPAHEVFSILCGNASEKPAWEFIVWESRFPQALTALLCGSSLSVCGLMLQTVFRNPLADPSILGISSGAGLGVAIAMLLLGGSLSTSLFSLSGFALILAGAFAGAMCTLFIILSISVVIKSNTLLLIVGIMIGYLASSAISLLNFFATAEGLQSYVLWGMGNFGGVSLQRLPVFATVLMAGLSASLLLIKPLNALLLGEHYARNLGIPTQRVRNGLLVIVGLLAAVTTAFCGPISFIGLAVPHITRMLLRTDNHTFLLPVTILCGGAVALFCNLLCTLPGEAGIIPLNAITPLIGAPVVIYVIISGKSRRNLN